MKKEKKVPRINFLPKDYSFAIIKTWHEIPNSQHFILSLPDDNGITPVFEKYNFNYKVVLLEFKKEFFVNSLENIEEIALSEIASELQKIREKNPTKIPTPMRMSDEYTGKLSLRISPALHKQLHIESIITDTSINKLVERKLKTE